MVTCKLNDVEQRRGGRPNGFEGAKGELVGVGAGRVTAKHLVAMNASRSTVSGAGALSGIDVTISGHGTCRGTEARFRGELEITFTDSLGRPLLRWKGTHVGRSTPSGSMFVRGAGVMELVSGSAPPELAALADQFVAADIAVDRAGSFGIRLWSLPELLSLAG